MSETFTYRGGQLAQTVTISGTTTFTDTYVYSQHGMPLELLRTSNGSTNRYWYLRDGLGNVVALTDVNGQVVDQYAYDLWGQPTYVSETVPQQLRYQGYWYDNELGWYWLSSRSYDPSLERFLQPDPSEQDGLFSYAYVGDDPVDLKDPSGFDSTSIACDTYCQTLIDLDNVWPTGMSLDQFESYGGNPDASSTGGYDPASHQWTGEAPGWAPFMGQEPPEPGGDASAGALADYYFKLLGTLTDQGLIDAQPYTGIMKDLLNPTTPEDYEQAKFALDLARDLRVGITGYSQEIFNINGKTRVGEIDVETPRVQIEFTTQGDFDGKVKQWYLHEEHADLMNPTGKARLVFVPDAKQASLNAARRDGVNGFNNYEDVLDFIRGLDE